MKIEIKVPAMGESISQATIGTIIKESGSFVSLDEELLELETDKVNQVLYAPETGVVTWNIRKDEQVKIGQVLGYVDTEQKASAISKPAAKKEASAPIESITQKPEKLAADKPKPSKESLEGARATKEAFIAEFSALPKSSQELKPSSIGKRGETRKKMTKIRKIISTRMVEVLQQTAMLTTFNEVDMTPIMVLRENYKEAFAKKHDTRLGFLSFFIKAVVSALQTFPEVNAYIDGEDLVYREYFDIGVAVGTERGVIVPVIRGSDRLSFAEIERAIENFAKKAREGGLSPDDLQGGGFTITNGGIYGSMLSTPILNPSQCAILGMHKIEKRPVVVNDQIVIRQMMYLALSYDHRILDGKKAVSFLLHVKNMLEDPSRLLLEV